MKYQNILSDGKVQCTVCPRQCVLLNNQEGFCLARKNVNGQIKSTMYGVTTGIAIDPVEKKPLYHFYPTSKALSFGTFGCNMGCKFCQNWQFTKTSGDDSKIAPATPEQIVQIAKNYRCKSVAFTYNDPVVFLEYAIDTAKLCKEAGLKTIAVTAGYINPEPAKELFQYMDAANIDLKGFSNDFYQKNCFANIEPVLETIKYAVKETNCWVELTTMLIECENDDSKEIQQECEWILNNLGDTVPLHFSAFTPHYKFQNRRPTEFNTLLKARQTALDAGIKYVYTGNLSTAETSTTYCKNCGKPVLVRSNYSLVEHHLSGNKCTNCGTVCDGHF